MYFKANCCSHSKIIPVPVSLFTPGMRSQLAKEPRGRTRRGRPTWDEGKMLYLAVM